MSQAGSAYLFSIARPLQLNVRLWLEGPYNTSTSLMNDDLRAAGYIPLLEPYTALGFIDAGVGGAETAPASVFTIGGNNAIVDWVRVELRASGAPATVVATHHALLQRDGDVVSASDGVSTIGIRVPAGNYHVVVRHRNHLGAMMANALALTTASTVVDFSSPANATYGTAALKTVGAVNMLWQGNVVRDGSLRFNGAGNDRDPILVRVGSTTPNNVLPGYWVEDVNLNGSVQYTGAGNDRDPILINVGSTTPNNVRLEQLP
jgi:hypothetical protein